MSHKPSGSVVLLVRGLPGSGKSYITRELARALEERSPVVLDPDTVDLESAAYKAHVQALTAEGVDKDLYLYRFLRTQAYKCIAAGKTVIWNQPFTNLDIFNKMVANFRVQAREHQVQLTVLVVEVEIDPAVAWQRVMDRKNQGGHGPSDGTFARFVDDYKTFADHGYQVVRVRGDDAPGAVNATMAALENL